eukprot:gnl/TRDRNA2_/TRDRNA2_198889_c0_seq1.p1 gnl/TRDRNA2_/TRDRNA2_198889_c0~~gnl/TRDRNA2_/TRDRNA2_198889_c0_seq1.p1  ORF type:complete len:323 (+),score=51.45 gnl/TRDRNA2_/TRDRNA2_198889_c0_seq1:38-1006(+)
MLCRAVACIAHSFARTVSTKQAIQRCVADYSVEVTPQAAKKVQSFADVSGLRPGTVVNVTFLVGSDAADTVTVCHHLVKAGMQAVAHVPARSFENLAAVESYLERLVYTGVREVLIIGGGVSQPVGELSNAMQILESGLLEKHGISRVGVAAHPEGHPDVAEDVMTAAMLRKALWAQANGIDLYYETQFCFEPEPILRWERRVRGLLTEKMGVGAKLPSIRLGVAGPAKVSNLIRFATLSGVGPSIRFVTKYTGDVLKLATTSSPDQLIYGIAAAQIDNPAFMVRQLHVYCFGGLQSTLKWMNAVEVGEFDIDNTSKGFVVR